LPVSKHTRKNRFKKDRAGNAGSPRQAFWLWIKAAFGCAGFVLMGLVFIFAYDALTQCDYFKAEAVEVSGARHLSKEAILETAEIEERVNIVAVNLSLTQRRLEAAPWIKSAAIRREFPSRINISVKEHEPLAVLDVGRFFLIDTNGGIFKEAAPSEMTGLPLISGLDYAEWKNPEDPGKKLYTAIMALLRVIEKQDRVFSSQAVHEISVDQEMGLTLRINHPMTIHLGYGDYAFKLQRIKRILGRIRGSDRIPAVRILDANNPNRIVATPKDRKTSEEKKEV